MYRDIYLDAPNVGVQEKKYLAKAIDAGYVSSVGPYVADFERAFARYLGIEKAVSTQNGTAAIHIVLHELGIGKGDEVIVPVSTFIATVNPIIYIGAKPVFVDIDIDTWNINAHEIEKNITKKTKAIIPVHLYGNPCAMSYIINIAKKHNLYVIEDATESLGATYNGKHTGTFGDFGCFSFNGNKIITTGGGGMVVGKDKKRLGHIKFLANQARETSDEEGYYHLEIGFNYRMTNIEASLGLAQINRLDKFLTQKRKFNFIYRNELKNVEALRFQDEYEGAISSCWLTCIVFERKIDTPRIQKNLKSKGIQTRRTFIPVVEFAPYRSQRINRFANAYTIYERGLCLPSSTLNSEGDILYVCKMIKEALKRA